MSEEHLTSSAILVIGSSALQGINYDNLISDFVQKKRRRRYV
jgi:hypothetical protein